MSRAPSPKSRLILTCEPCRSSKLRCDQRKPICSRCHARGRACHYISQVTKSESGRSSGERRRPLIAPGNASEDCESARVPPRAISASLSVDLPQSLDLIHHGPGSQRSLRSKSDEQEFAQPLPHLNRNYPVQRRIRAAVSCARCRKLKVKCDRQNPCGRCRKYGQHCRYLPFRLQNTAYPTGERETSALKGDTMNKRGLWRAKHCADSHWVTLFYYAENVLEKRGVGVNHLENDPEPCLSSENLTLPNYPFVECWDSKVISHKLPPRATIELLVQRYFDTTGKMFRIMDLSAFEVELQHFWELPEQASPGWMAQLLLIMSLGCDSLNTVDDEFATSHGHLPNLFLDQANVFLHRTPFMFRPDLYTIRTLCLMVLAKQIIRNSCFEEDTSWCLTGTIKRLAMSIGLHLDQPSNTLPHLESDARRALWTIILYLDLRQSVLSGLPILIEPLHLSFAVSNSLGFSDSPSPLSRVSTPQSASNAACEEIFQNFFRKVLPLAHEIALAARSVDYSYEKAIRDDEEVRQVLREVRWLSADLSSPATPHHDCSILQWEAIHLDILFRRLLLELHRRFAYKPQAVVHYAVSHWSTLDCAAAILVHQRNICEKSESSTAGQWLSGIFRSDFFVAGLTVSLYLVQSGSQLDSPTLPGGYARETLLETLRSCRDIWALGKNLDLCQFKRFQFIDRVISTLD
ncbi:uncharacterized protein Z518_03529 [Rhinocladiella mackenziei CBS 650.93]|uniref:Zn(2)-C6 fungal-type domain-containing protein n=1 Tax=Rhinocladiella mackenziei CBS 650.93 TaxID=1442369 RepID=A0A0D2G2U4_9EURO|nr:uncharacterized protein Z518_03529 [Rhinocladiella mackenziei CBS 650.93]KIX08872.1 hypothetical protein Z518_03529 [Rhinocladiella mackenziei CBS 650.93]